MAAFEKLVAPRTVRCSVEEDRRVDGAEYRRYYHQHSTPDDSRSTAVAEYCREARGWCTVQTVLSLTPNK